MLNFMRRRKAGDPPSEQKALPEASPGHASTSNSASEEIELLVIEADDESVPLTVSSAGTSMTMAISMIGEDMEVRGPITTASALRISGEVTGDITAGDEVIVDRGGQVVGRIQATRVIVRGSVRGHVASSGRLLIESTGKIHGDVVAKSLHIDDGGQLQGRCSMKSDA